MINALLVLLSAIFFAISNPGFVAVNGIAFVAWFCYVPLFFVVHRSSFKSVWFFGGLFGALSFAMYVFWMIRGYTVGFIVVVIGYFFYYALLFLFLKLMEMFFACNAWIAQWIFWNVAEYVRTTGFLGMNYGVTGYTQWRYPLVIAISRLGGVWAVTAIVTLCSALIFKIISDALASVDMPMLKRRDDVHIGTRSAISMHDALSKPCGEVAREMFHALKISCRKNILPFAIFAAVFCASLIYGASVQKDWSVEKSVRVVAVQHNTDPWIGGITAYKADVENLKKLSSDALSADDSIRLVVWPETSVVPSIMLHYTQRKDRERYDMIRSLLEYIDEKNAVFVLGNDHAVPRSGRHNDDYNSVFVFTPQENTLPPTAPFYAKRHLVPFTEYFPWPEQFPGFYQMLLDGDTHQWTPGTPVTPGTHGTVGAAGASMGKETDVFYAAGLSFATPVCFEDTFGDDCRRMILSGARAFVNLSNDAWSHSRACQIQHLAMATLRCVENAVPAVRSTASGETCILNPNGKITSQAEPFVATYVIGDLPVIDADAPITLYTKYGDVLVKIFMCCAFLCIVFGCIRRKLSND